jgi:hypothetical protein
LALRPLKRRFGVVARSNALSAPTGFVSVANRCFGARHRLQRAPLNDRFSKAATLRPLDRRHVELERQLPGDNPRTSAYCRPLAPVKGCHCADEGDVIRPPASCQRRVRNWGRSFT